MMVILLIFGILLGLGLPRYAQSRGRAALTACVQNERNIGTALQTYANDNDGKFPTDLTALTAGTPAPLPVLPTCPTNRSSYVTAYQVDNSTGHYTVVCAGVHHLQLSVVQSGFPQYYSTGRLEIEGNQ